MRNISCSLTKQAIIDHTKFVTRRLGWRNAKAGQLLQACEKCMGLKPGEKIVKLAVIRLVNVRLEPLDAMITDRAYGFREVVLEGFPGSSKAPAAQLRKGLALLALNKKDAGIHELRLLIQRHPQTPEATQARSKLNGLGVRITPAPAPTH